jgi:hypothetical protein
MSLKIQSIAVAADEDTLNSEWIIVSNEGDKPFNAEGCSISVAKGTSRPRLVTTFQAGLIIKPQEVCRLITGSSGKKSHGEAPVEENVRNVHLFLKARYLERPGLVVRLMNRQRELCRATVDPAAPSGILPEENKGPGQG